MNLPAPTIRSSARRESGLVLILVVATLVLLVILGLMYLQVARITRSATINIANRNIDDVAYATLDLISSTLKNDVIDPDGNTFSTDEAEPYDYPYTAANKGTNDDAWLASTYPRVFNNTVTWPHLTNLGDEFLILPSTADRPTEVTANASEDTDIIAMGPGVSLEDPLRGGDASGDGIPDARYQWAPIRQIAGVEYVMLVRVIDNSSLINFNTASALTSTNTREPDTSIAGTNAPRYTTPGELDMVRFMSAIRDRVTASYTNNWQSDLATLLDYRQGLNTTPTPYAYGTTGHRQDFWMNGPAMYGSYGPGYTRYPIEDELELRRRNGLNDETTTTALEDGTTGMRDFLRAGAAIPRPTENSYLDYTENTFGDDSDVSLAQRVLNAQRFFQTNPRQMMTTLSGANELAARLPNDAEGLLPQKNLNYYLGLDPIAPDSPEPDQTRLLALIDDFEQVLNIGSFNRPAGFSSNRILAAQYAASLRDYADTDYRITQITLTDGTRIAGLESLPFIAEVMVVRPYEWTTAPTGSPGNWTGQVTAEGSVGFAIEICNPFQVNLPTEALASTALFVNGTQVGTLIDLLGPALTIANGGTFLRPGDRVIIHQSPSSGGLTPMTNIFKSASGYISAPVSGINWPTDPNNVSVEIRGRLADDSDFHDWSYSRVDTVPGLPDSPGNLTTSSLTAPTINEIGYHAATRLGSANGLNALTVASADFTLRSIVAFGDLNASDVRAINELGVTGDKPGGPAPEINLANGLTQIPFSHQGAIRTMGEMFYLSILGGLPDATDTGVGAFWDRSTGNAANLENPLDTFFRINPRANIIASSAHDHLQVPHALLLARRVSLLTPFEDFIDGALRDNDGNSETDNPSELFVPGRININTAGLMPSSINQLTPPMRWAAYLPTDNVNSSDPLTDEIFRKIIAYRDIDPAVYPAGRASTFGMSTYRERPGIAHISELFMIDFDDARVDASSSDVRAINNVRTDWNNPINASAVLPDTGIDDREEQMMIGDFFAQTFTTRSDIFTAYIVIRGYPGGRFDQPATQVKRMLAIIDRSNLADEKSTPKILAIRELN